MKKFRTANYLMLMGCLGMGLSMASCSDDDDTTVSQDDYKYVGQAVGNFTADEWYPGGRLGTTDNITAGCYEDETPAVNEQGLIDAFNHGEYFFERTFSATGKPFNGLGPASVRKSCLDCHPGYGHGKRQESYKAGFGNGYLLVVYSTAKTGPGSNDGPYISQVTGMPQTQAQSPFLPPIDESGIKLSWHKVDKMESGLPMKFPDGEEYSLIYPELTIASSAFNTDPRPSTDTLGFRLESTIGIIGTGMIDAIPQEEIIKQYESEAAYFKSQGMDVKEYLNPSMWDAAANQPAASAWYSNFTAPGALADGQSVDKVLKRYTYALTRGTLQDGAGANAIWNITNVSRPDRPKLYTTDAWALAMSKNNSVIEAIKKDPSSPYYNDGTDTGIAEAVKALLSPKTNQFDNPYHNFEAEMSNDNYYDFMVWHRGLAIPRARNLNDPQVQRGKKLFTEMGCASCHRPQWKTGDDNYWISNNIKGKKLPRYANQTIYPYSDFVQHKLYMKNDIHGSWCRTTPLWGRGLSLANTGAEDRLHDCRARNEVEAIMWHAYSKQSHAYAAAEKFYKLKKADRDAVVKFLRSI